MSGETQVQNNGERPQASEWDSLASQGEKIRETQEKAKEFTQRELQRLANAVNRTPDDEGVIKLNLVLRYEEFRRLRDSIQTMKQNGTMVQQGPLEDLATAKRELEEAMYLYDPTFAKDDAKTESINEDQHRADAKDYLRKDKHNSEGAPKTGEAMTSNSWVKARMARKKAYDKKRDVVSEHRDQASQRLANDLDKISEQFKTEIIGGENLWDTYNGNRGDEPRMKERRIGYDGAGKDGLFGAGASKGKNMIDWTLYPHAPEDISEDPEPTPVEPTLVDPNPVPPDPEPTPVDPEPNPVNPEPFGILPPAPDPFGILPPAPPEPTPPENPPALPPAGPEKPLVAINADFSWDKTDLSRHFAKQELDKELESSNFIKKIWKGNLFKKYYQRKYEREINEGSREVTLGDGSRATVEDIIELRSDSAIQRFVIGVTEEYGGLIHDKAGEKLTEADAKTTEAVKTAIEKFAQAKIPEGGSLEDLMREFGNDVRRMQAEARDRGEPLNDAMINNYYEVAVQAREYVEHGVAMERVMEGFKVYNADVRNNVRTQEHRDGIDTLVDKFEKSKVGQFIPPEIVAAALGSAYSLTRTGAKALGGAGFGIIVSGVQQGLRERNRAIEDRARMQRDLASGREYDGSKHETRIGGTLYDLCPANELTTTLENALETGNTELILSAIAEARVRIDFSDSNEKDLIAYSSGEKIGNERLALDIALARAESSLSDEERANLENMKEAIQGQIVESVDKKDAEFNKVKNVLALKQAGKTMLAGAITFFASQEIRAIFDPTRIGVVEKIAEKHGIIHATNNADASETMLASLGGVETEPAIEVSGDDTARITELEEQGYRGVMVREPSTDTVEDTTKMNISETGTNTRMRIGWFNNGTTYSDGAERHLYWDPQRGYHTGMNGDVSFTQDGRVGVFSHDVSRPGGIGAFLEAEDGTHYQFQTEIVDGELIIPTDSEGYATTIDGLRVPVALDENGYCPSGTIFVASIDGVEPGGLLDATSYAAVPGSDTWDGVVDVTTTKPEEIPALYEFVRNRDVDYSGVTLPFVTRTGLGESRDRNTESETPTTGPDRQGQSPVETPSQPGGNGGEGNNPPETGGDNESPIGGEEPPVTTPEEAQARTEEEARARAEEEALAQAEEEARASAEASRQAAEEEARRRAELEQILREREQASEDTTEAERYRNGLMNRIGNLIGEEGINIMSAQRSLNEPDMSQRIQEWWNGLDEYARSMVRGEVVRQGNNSPYGADLRDFLANQQ